MERLVQFITHRNARYGYVEGAELALRGGCKWIQLRMKDATDEEIRQAVVKLKPACRQYGATLIIDDRVDIALEMNADGVHLGKKDMPVSEARHMAGSKFIIGGTANTLDDFRRLHEQGADYIGCGPFKYTTTKQKLAPILGIGGYRDIMCKARAEGINLPTVAIGGIIRKDIPAIMATGVDGIAISGAVINAENPEKEMGEIMRTMTII